MKYNKVRKDGMYMDRQFNVGDKVFWIDDNDELSHGVVSEVIETDKGVFGKVNDEACHGAETYASFDRCYGTEDECMAAHEREEQARYQNFMDNINDVNDLVKFMWESNFQRGDEYCDEAARKVIVNKAKGLIGYDLENGTECSDLDSDFANAVDSMPTVGTRMEQ